MRLVSIPAAVFSILSIFDVINSLYRISVLNLKYSTVIMYGYILHYRNNNQ